MIGMIFGVEVAVDVGRKRGDYPSRDLDTQVEHTQTLGRGDNGDGWHANPPPFR